MGECMCVHMCDLYVSKFRCIVFQNSIDLFCEILFFT